jgi:hypothetical protein
MALTREQFEGLQPVTKEVPVHGTGETVFIRAISARTREDFDSMVTESGDDKIPDLPARLVCLCLCNASGDLWYPEAMSSTDELASNAKRVSEKLGAPVIEQLFYECRDLNRMNKGAVEEAAKNSEPDPADSSSTD